MKTEKTERTHEPGATLGFLLLRLWLGVRALLTGIAKFGGSVSSDQAVLIDGAPNSYGLTAAESVKVYGLSHYHGVPEVLYRQLEADPLVPGFLLVFFNAVIGPLLIVLGIALLLGLAMRVSLFVSGLTYVAFTAGLILLKQDAGIAWLGIHIALTALALFHVRYNRFGMLKNW